MADLPNLNLHCRQRTIGALPTSYLASLSYEEQLLCIGAKTDEIVTFINSVLEQSINEYINAKFNDMVINALYEPSTETLVLYLDSNSNN